MTSENGPVVIGKDIYVDLGDAIAKLLNKKKDDLAPTLAGLRIQATGQTYKSIVIYAPGSEAAAGRELVDEDGILRVGHEITRQRMSSLFTSLAFAFNVAPRRL